jgi:hypothetical protein
MGGLFHNARHPRHLRGLRHIPLWQQSDNERFEGTLLRIRTFLAYV